jgi:hypothetical protein
MATAEIEVPGEALPTLEQANDDISRPIFAPTWRYYLLLAICGVGILAGGTAWAIQIKNGIGMAGINNPVSWGVYIVTFVFWVGIAHSGTLISAVFRSSISGGCGISTIWCLIPPPACYGRISGLRSYGTCSRSAPISRSASCSGTSD